MTIKFETAMFLWVAIVASYLAFPWVNSEAANVLSWSNSDPTEVPSPSPQSAYPLSIITTPENATIKVMNIKAKYKRGMKLLSGKYDIEVSAEGYTTQRQWIKLPATKKDLTFSLNPKREVIKVELK